MGTISVCLRRKRSQPSLQPLLYDAICISFTPQILAGKTRLEVTKQVIITVRKVTLHGGCQRTCHLSVAGLLSLVKHLIPAFLEQQTPFPHIPFSHCTSNTHFNDLIANFCRTGIISFKTVYSSQFTHVSWSSLTTTMNERKIATPYWAIHVFPLTYRRQQTTGSAHVNCAAAIHCRFLLSGRAFYVFGIIPIEIVQTLFASFMRVT